MARHALRRPRVAPDRYVVLGVIVGAALAAVWTLAPSGSETLPPADTSALGATGTLPSEAAPGEPAPDETAPDGTAPDQPAPGEPSAPDGSAAAPGAPGPGGAVRPEVRPGAADRVAGRRLGIPAAVLAAYRAAEARTARTAPSCHLSWSLVAAIGKVESSHARNGAVRPDGVTRGPILGPRLDGDGGHAAIRDTDDGVLDRDAVWDRAIGPAQFIPSTWRGYGTDGNGDGRRDPHNVYDAAGATGRYLCAGGTDLATPSGRHAAVFRYNHSRAYVARVLAWARAYGSAAPIPTPGGGGVAQAEPTGRESAAVRAAAGTPPPAAAPRVATPRVAAPRAAVPRAAAPAVLPVASAPSGRPGVPAPTAARPSPPASRLPLPRPRPVPGPVPGSPHPGPRTTRPGTPAPTTPPGLGRPAPAPGGSSRPGVWPTVGPTPSGPGRRAP